MKLPKKIKYPNFKEITKLCKGKMDEKFEEYGNSWKQEPFDISWTWWEKRLKNEIKEIFETNHPVQMRDEIIDAINILAMMYQNNRRSVEWHFAELRMGRHG